jgi:hypothetical protein
MLVSILKPKWIHQLCYAGNVPLVELHMTLKWRENELWPSIWVHHNNVSCIYPETLHVYKLPNKLGL